MVRIGYTMMTEQAGPRELVGHVAGAARAGFDFSVTSDHCFSWLDSQGHAPPIGVAVSGERSCEVAGHLADLLIAPEPKADLISEFDRHGGAGKPKMGRLPICYDTDRDAAGARAHDRFRWFGGGRPVNSELPGPEGFAGATQFVRPEDAAGSIPCGDDADSVVSAVRPFVEAGFTEVALVQIGGDHQEPYLEWAERKLLPALRDL